MQLPDSVFIDTTETSVVERYETDKKNGNRKQPYDWTAFLPSGGATAELSLTSDTVHTVMAVFVLLGYSDRASSPRRMDCMASETLEPRLRR